MKKIGKKQILLVSALILMAAITVAAVSYAWLASNRVVQADGVTMTADTSPNLVIANATGSASGQIGYAKILDTSSPFKVTFTPDAEAKLVPITVVDDNGTLAYLADTSNVIPSTGLPSSGTVASSGLTTVTSSGTGVEDQYYYLEYTVYIASAEAAFHATHLYVTMTSPEKVTSGSSATTDTHMAASVAIFVGDSPVYKGHLNLASQGEDTEPGKVDLASNTGIDIPLNTASSTSYIEVTLRYYFDGALEKTAGTVTYVRSAQLDVSALANVGLTFTATTD